MTHDRRDRSARHAADARPLRGARAARAVRARQSRRDAARARLRARRARDRRRGQAPALPRAPRRHRRRQRDRVRLRRRGSTRTRATAATTSRSGSRRTAGTAPSRRSSSCVASSRRAERFDELRDWLVAEYRKPAAARDADATAIFAELEIERAGLGRRHLLESERFRALLEVSRRSRAPHDPRSRRRTTTDRRSSRSTRAAFGDDRRTPRPRSRSSRASDVVRPGARRSSRDGTDGRASSATSSNTWNEPSKVPTRVPVLPAARRSACLPDVRQGAAAHGSGARPRRRLDAVRARRRAASLARSRARTRSTTAASASCRRRRARRCCRRPRRSDDSAFQVEPCLDPSGRSSARSGSIVDRAPSTRVVPGSANAQRRATPFGRGAGRTVRPARRATRARARASPTLRAFSAAELST